jgi:Na+/proline symporter
MVIYETLGGMRSVAWTDVIQGVVLLLGFSILLFIIPGLGGGMTQIVEKLSVDEVAMVTVPSLETCNSWISFVLLLGCGAAIYPQAIQRLYASRNTRVLKRSLAVMAFLPLTTTLIALLCGVTGRVVLPGIEGVETDQVLARLCALVMEQSTAGYWLVVVIFAAALAALMSTADSALLSISSMFTRDIYQAHFRPQGTQAELTLVGKLVSWVVVAILVVIAISTEKTLVRLLELKFEVLIQVVPCFFLGLYWRRLTASVALAGMLAGLAVALGLTAVGMTKVVGFHAGVVGLGLNFIVCALGTWIVPGTVSAMDRKAQVLPA